MLTKQAMPGQTRPEQARPVISQCPIDCLSNNARQMPAYQQVTYTPCMSSLFNFMQTAYKKFFFFFIFSLHKCKWLLKLTLGSALQFVLRTRTFLRQHICSLACPLYVAFPTTYIHIPTCTYSTNWRVCAHMPACAYEYNVPALDSFACWHAARTIQQQCSGSIAYKYEQIEEFPASKQCTELHMPDILLLLYLDLYLPWQCNVTVCRKRATHTISYQSMSSCT